MRHALCMVMVASLASVPAFAQAADAPLAVLDACPPGSIVLDPATAIETAKRLASAEAKVAVYEQHPPLPVWGVVLLVAAGVLVGVAGTVGVYEVTRVRP